MLGREALKMKRARLTTSLAFDIFIFSRGRRACYWRWCLSFVRLKIVPFACIFVYSLSVFRPLLLCCVVLFALRVPAQPRTSETSWGAT